MPAKPRWYANLASIRRSVAAMTATPFFDRRAVEQLFGVKSRQAVNIMRELESLHLGSARVVRREELLLRLDQMAAPRGVPQAEMARKAGLVSALDELRLKPRPRRIPPPVRVAGSALPAGVVIAAPGLATIAFDSPEDLLSRILFLAQSASADFAAFAASVDYQPGAASKEQP